MPPLVPGERVAVLLAAGGAGWEVEALRGLADASRLVLLKRCVDLPDLLATATTGQAQVAVVAADLPGLDVDSTRLLWDSGVGVVVVHGDGAAGPRLPGVHADLTVEDLGRLAETVVHAATALPAAESAGVTGDTSDDTGVLDADATPPGRLVAVWGPAGAPGRTTVAVGIAAVAARTTDTLLVDADPYGGSVAQHLGVLDEASGLLGAARLANAGRLDPAGLAGSARAVGPGLRVLTGLPRPDRWAEVRASAFDDVLGTALALCPLVVADLGFCLEQAGPSYGAGGPQRNQMTVTALDRADEVVVVGSADPVGLSRLARGLVELLDVVPAATVRVVVNRARPSLGWGEREVRAMVEGFVTPVGVHFSPHDLGSADRAVMEGCPVVDVPGSPLARSLEDLAGAVTGTGGGNAARRGPRRTLRRRTAGRAR